MKMTLQQHKLFGQALKEFRETLLQSHILNAGNARSFERRAVEKLLKTVDHAKHIFDSAVFNDCRGCGEDLVEIYYGASDKWIAHQEEISNRTQNTQRGSQPA